MKPTDEQINLLMAEVCGWHKAKQEDGMWVIIKANGEKHSAFKPLTEAQADDWLPAVVPGYCTDRNTLPEVWQTLQRAGALKDFWRTLELLCARDAFRWFELPGMAIVAAEPRLHVLAALKALGKWPAEWEV